MPAAAPIPGRPGAGSGPASSGVPPGIQPFRRLRRSELPVDTASLARYLIGKILVHEAPRRMSGRIVESEAYVVGDAAAHSHRGMTPRNRSLFIEHRHADVYFIYGNWYSMNVSGEAEGVGGGVLLRALEPIEGIDLMRRRRPGAPVHRLASGPGCLATALGIDKRCDGLDLCASGPIWLGEPLKGAGSLPVSKSVRIGITKEAHRMLRFYERGNPSVSGPKRLRD
jgi:DNA-3-methyladenine glycosylase